MPLSEANRRAERGRRDVGVLENLLVSPTPGRDAQLDAVGLETLCDSDKLLGLIQARIPLPLRTNGMAGRLSERCHWRRLHSRGRGWSHSCLLLPAKSNQLMTFE
jgi:hypothetical protein